MTRQSDNTERYLREVFPHTKLLPAQEGNIMKNANERFEERPQADAEMLGVSEKQLSAIER